MIAIATTVDITAFVNCRIITHNLNRIICHRICELCINCVQFLALFLVQSWQLLRCDCLALGGIISNSGLIHAELVIAHEHCSDGAIGVIRSIKDTILA